MLIYMLNFIQFGATIFAYQNIQTTKHQNFGANTICDLCFCVYDRYWQESGNKQIQNRFFLNFANNTYDPIYSDIKWDLCLLPGLRPRGCA